MRVSLAGVIWLVIWLPGQLPAQEPKFVATTGKLQVRRHFYQQDSVWVIVYDVKNTSAAPVTYSSANMTVKMESWVSNSAVAGHSVPRFSSTTSRGVLTPATCELIKSADAALQCQEKMSVEIHQGGKLVAPCTVAYPVPPAPPLPDAVGDQGDEQEDEQEEQKKARGEEPPDVPPPPAPLKMEKKPAEATVTIPPGGVVQIHITLAHRHVLYGDLDLLLGTRACQVTLDTLGAWSDADIECVQHHLVVPAISIPPPPEDHRDTVYFISAPDSLYLAAHISGNQYFNVPEMPVRYGTLYRVRFWYLIAFGGDGEAHVRFKQMRDTPTAWKILSEGAMDEQLKVGRWYKFERVIRTQPTANRLQIDFRVTGNIGEAWIDDLSVEAVGFTSNP